MRIRTTFFDDLRRRANGRVVIWAQMPAPPDDGGEALKALRLQADEAKARADKLAKEMEDLRKQMPTEEQRARYAELEAQAEKAKEERFKEEGDFNEWRRQTNEKYEKDIQAERSMRENAVVQASKIERELDDTLVAREFADATDLFGPTGKTVLLPEVARSFLAEHVEVQKEERNGAIRRRVVVKDLHGAVIIDTKNGQPQTFGKAMNELIENHPRKEHLLRNSGRAGSGSPGGTGSGNGGIDTRNLKSRDFERQDVRDAVRNEQASSGALRMGPAFDRIRQANSKK